MQPSFVQPLQHTLQSLQIAQYQLQQLRQLVQLIPVQLQQLQQLIQFIPQQLQQLQQAQAQQLGQATSGLTGVPISQPIGAPAAPFLPLSAFSVPFAGQHVHVM